MRFLQFLLVCFAPIILLAQNAFIHEYGRTDFGNYVSAIPYGILEYKSNIHLFGITFYAPENSETANRFLHTKIKIDDNSASSIIDSTLYSNGYFRKAVIRNNFFYVAGVKWNDLPKREKKKFLSKIDENGNIIWSKSFGDTSHSIWDNFIQDIYSVENDFVVLSSGYDGVSSPNFEFTVLNENGEFKFKKLHKTHPNILYVNTPIESEQTTDGFLVIMEGIFGPPEAENLQTLLKLDKQGDELWRKSLNDIPLPERENIDSLQQAFSVFKMKNDHFGVVFQLFRMDSNNQFLEISKNVIVEFDAGGNYIQSKEILEKLNFDIKKTESNSDGDIYIFGNVSGETHVAKIDDEFNVLWSINYGTENHNIYSDGCTTSDAGMALTGTRFRWTEPKGWNYYVVKTDCNGNVEWDSESCVNPSDEEISVFGNPMRDKLLIQFPQMKDDVNLEFRLYNSIGQLVMNRQITGPIIHEHVSQLSAGIYLFTVKADNGSFFNGKLMKE